jgi:hypothetical protein
LYTKVNINMSNQASEWDSAYFYEFRIVSADSVSTVREFRCPVCHDPLRQGLGPAENNSEKEKAGEGWDNPVTGIGKDALMCPKLTCRAYFKLTM